MRLYLEKETRRRVDLDWKRPVRSAAQKYLEEGQTGSSDKVLLFPTREVKHAIGSLLGRRSRDPTA